MSRPRFIEELRSQLGLIQRHSDIFDAGYEDEAKSLSANIRGLFASTEFDPPRNQKSKRKGSRSTVALVDHLEIRDWPMLSSASGPALLEAMANVIIDLSNPQPVRMVPRFRAVLRPIEMAAWWNQEPIFSSKGKEVTRRLMVCSMANRDGGVHVDAELDAFYESLKEGEVCPWTFDGANLKYSGPPPFDQTKPQRIRNAHFVIVRQIAHEVLATAHQFRWVPRLLSEESAR